LLRPPLALARRTASSIKSDFIPSSLHHFTSATWRRFHRRRLTHATDFFQAAGFTVRGGVSVIAENYRKEPEKGGRSTAFDVPIFRRQRLTLTWVEWR
jgi:hypothetical protein